MTHPTFLGKVLDTTQAQFVTKWSIFEKFFRTLHDLKGKSVVTLRKMESLIGLFATLSNRYAQRWCDKIRDIIRPALALRAAKMGVYHVKIPQHFWDDLTEDWLAFLQMYRHEQTLEDLDNPLYIITDASDTTELGGGYLISNGKIKALESFPLPPEATTDSTIAELWTLVEICDRNQEIIHALLQEHDGITTVSDNLALHFYVNTARCGHTQASGLIRKLYDILQGFKVPFTAIWQRRDTTWLKIADYTSRPSVSSGYTKRFFKAVYEEVGHFTVYAPLSQWTTEARSFQLRIIRELQEDGVQKLYIPYPRKGHYKEILRCLNISKAKGIYIGPPQGVDIREKEWVDSRKVLYTFTLQEALAKIWFHTKEGIGMGKISVLRL